MTTFHTPENEAGSTVAAARTAGAAPLVLADGSSFGTAYPKIVTVSRAGATLCILEATARSGDTLTISGAIEGTTDVDLAAGDGVQMRPTKLAMTEVQAAINALEASSVDLTTDQTIGGTKTLTGGISGPSGQSVTWGTNQVAISPSGNVHLWVLDAGVLGPHDAFFQIVTLSNSYGFIENYGGLGMVLSGPSVVLAVDRSAVATFAATLATLATALSLPTLSDAAAPNGSLYLGSDHLDVNSAPKLCRRDAAGNITPIG